MDLSRKDRGCSRWSRRPGSRSRNCASPIRGLPRSTVGRDRFLICRARATSCGKVIVNKGQYRWQRAHVSGERVEEILEWLNAQSRRQHSILTQPFRLSRERAPQQIELDPHPARTYRFTIDPYSPRLSNDAPWRPIIINEITKIEVLAARPGRVRRSPW